MTMRNYSLVLLVGVIASMFFPRDDAVHLLDGTSPLSIATASGPVIHTTVIGEGVEVAQVTRLGLKAMFQLVINGNEVYTVQATCDPSGLISIDPDVRVDQQKLKAAISWVCA